MPPKSTTPTKASESVVARMMARMLGVPVSDSLDAVCMAYVDEGTNRGLTALLQIVHGLYPWVTDVARDVMTPKTTPLTEHIMSMPGFAFVVKDSAFSGDDSLWLVVGDSSLCERDSLRNLEHRGLTHTFRLPDGDLAHVIAIQLNSCRP
jgi:hypothetical protein